jgi:TIR domain
MPSIFVSFRKADNRWMRDRVYQTLSESFGANEVFKSGESIPAGSDFAKVLRRQAAECKIMLVLIGTAWTDARASGGSRLLDRGDDWVRTEIATALDAGNRVIPVLLGDTVTLPAPVALPDDIAELAQLQFLRVPETHLDDGLRRLASTLSEMLPHLVPHEANAPDVPKVREVTFNNHATGQIGLQAGQVTGGTFWIGSDTDPAAPADLSAHLAALRDLLEQQRSAGRIDETTYKAAQAELAIASDALAGADTPEGRNMFILALKRLRGLIADVTDLATRVAAMIVTAKAL